MSRPLKSSFAAWLAIAIIAAILGGCTQSDKPAAESSPSGQASTEPSAQPSDSASPSADNGPSADQPGWMLDTSPVTFKWFLDASWYQFTWGDSAVSKYITEKTGVTIDFDVPSGDSNQKLTTLIASDSLPDFLSVGFWEDNFKKLQESGMVYALNELADQYDPYFFKVAGDASLKWYKQPDGNTYVMPNEAYTVADMQATGVTNANQTFLVRKDLYEEMGSPDMRTPEGFLGALRLLKEKYSTYKGQKIIPFFAQGASPGGVYGLEEMLMNMLAIPYEKDGQIYDRYSDPEYIRWLKTFNQAYREKLITIDFMVDQAPQINQKINNASYFSMMQEWTGVEAAIAVMSKDDPSVVYQAIDGPANSSLQPAQVFPGSMTGWLPVMISKNTKNPERAIRFLTYLVSEEGQKDIFLGKQGETWDTIDGKDQLLPEVKKAYDEDQTAFGQKYGAVDTYWQLRNPVLVSKWRPEKIAPIQQMVDWSNKHADFSKVYVKELDPLGNSPEGIAFTKIQQVFGQTLPKLITAGSESEFDGIWQKFLNEREKLSVDLVQQYRQKQLETSKAKLAD